MVVVPHFVFSTVVKACLTNVALDGSFVLLLLYRSCQWVDTPKEVRMIAEHHLPIRLGKDVQPTCADADFNTIRTRATQHCMSDQSLRLGLQVPVIASTR